MAFSDFYQNNKTIVIVVVVIIILLLVYYFFFSGGSNTVVVRPRVTVTRDSKFDTCMEPEIQERIANKISKKIDELKGCDCQDECGVIHSPVEDEEVASNQITANIREAFKKYK